VDMGRRETGAGKLRGRRHGEAPGVRKLRLKVGCGRFVWPPFPTHSSWIQFRSKYPMANKTANRLGVEEGFGGVREKCLTSL
jgi:hypothetical protein